MSSMKYLTAIPTAAVVLCAYIGTVNLPEHNIFLPEKESNIMVAQGTSLTTYMSWEDSGNPYYQFIKDNGTIAEQINIIHNFVSTLLQDSQDLDPRFSKVVDKYFWDLA